MNGRHNGFSLFEIMIAVAILGFIGMLTFGTFARAMDGKERAEEITSYYHGIRQGMLRMSREIENTFITMHHDCEDARTRSLFATQNSSGGTRLDFTAFTHYKVRADANEDDQEEIGYFIGPDPDDKKHTALMRRSDPRIDAKPAEGGVEQVLTPRATKLAFEFYDAKNDRWIDEWDTRNIDYRDRLPMFVAIKLTVLDPHDKEETFTVKTRVVLRNAILIPGTGFVRCAD
ncbi:MAG: prepilin-type N-terminal cleavage/methylation domain-containing protein [Clostridia bacterium]|nr:prepilin-type N-terminal cleavage/methylation domain-containing protein [Deltaproteobacteria bacterium]